MRGARLRASGRIDAAAHLEQHTDIAEVEAIARIACFAEWTGAAVHIAHLSSRHSLPQIRFAKSRGVNMTVETCPHYLLLSTADGARLGETFLRVKPPLRAPGHADALWQALRDGTIDILSTDHAPHLPTQKRCPVIWDCAPGFAGVETSMPLMLAQVNHGRMTLCDYVRMSAEAPAAAFALTGKGHLAVGADADIVLVDMTRRGQITAGALHSIGASTPFEGFEVWGQPVRTLVRGTTVCLDGAIVAQPGHGRLLRH
ncbi:MAG TPA: dihydroorotase family protein [Paenirhodobacter sp.]